MYSSHTVAFFVNLHRPIPHTLYILIYLRKVILITCPRSISNRTTNHNIDITQ